MCNVTLPIRPDLKGVLDHIIEKTGSTINELIEMGIFLYYPDIFLESDIENVKIWLFLDKNEQDWLKAICEYYGKTESEMLLDLIANNVS